MLGLDFIGLPVSGTPFGTALELHWTGLGCIGLTLLFIPSLRMTEEISAGRYPGYREYQAAVPALIPLPRRGRTKAAD